MEYSCAAPFPTAIFTTIQLPVVLSNHAYGVHEITVVGRYVSWSAPNVGKCGLTITPNVKGVGIALCRPPFRTSVAQT